MILVGCMIRANLGGEAHDMQGATVRGLDWNGGGDVYRNDCTDAVSYHGFHEPRWSVEILRLYRHSKSVLNFTVRRSDLLSMIDRAQAVTHQALYKHLQRRHNSTRATYSSPYQILLQP